MTARVLLLRGRAWVPIMLAAVLVAATTVALSRWVAPPPPPPILSAASDKMELALDRTIVGTMADFTLWNRLNIAVQSATILLGLTATLLTASATPGNTKRLKIATVSVTALTAALVAVQSTFHLRENIHTDATAFTRLVVLEADYIYARHHLAAAKTDAASLRRDTVQALTRLRSDRMLSLANIGAGAQPLDLPSPTAACADARTERQTLFGVTRRGVSALLRRWLAVVSLSGSQLRRREEIVALGERLSQLKARLDTVHRVAAWGQLRRRNPLRGLLRRMGLGERG